MQKPFQGHDALGQKGLIVPASARGTDGAGSSEVAGYAVHTGEARSTEDVTVRGGTAPIIERGQERSDARGDDDEIEESLAESPASSQGAPD